VPQDETLEAYQQLIREGKIRAIGASNFTAARLKSSIETAKLHGLPSYQSLQPEYNFYDREKFEKELEPLCRAENIGVISYYSLARGFLTGKYRTEDDLGKSTRGQSVKREYYNERGWRILKVLDEVSAELKTTPARLSLAWLMARPGITAPIASATNMDQLEEMMAAAELKLNTAIIEKMNAASAY
jgi:aryl-alcohol dehydrogenase-like predicted oxidoreductase